MSKEGIKKVAGVLSMMQETRGSLIRDCVGKDRLLDKQDLLLAQLLEEGKDAIKEKFAKLTLMKGGKDD